MAGGMMVGRQEAGRQGHSNQVEDVANVVIPLNQQVQVEGTSRTTRAMARAAGGL